MPQIFEFDATVNDTISEALNVAPERIFGVVRKRLYIERNKFVGKKKSGLSGSFTRSVLRYRRRGREGTMPLQVAGMFRGFLKTPEYFGEQEMALRLGILSKRPKPFVRGLIELQHGDTTHTSGKFMPVPVYDNLAKLGITSKFGRTFRQMIESDRLVSIRTGGQVLWIDKEQIEAGANIAEATLFVGTKRVTARRMNFGFIEKFITQWPAWQTRMKNAVDREISNINKGYHQAN
jgi:hypothetical protein